MHTITVLADGLKFPEGPMFDAAGRLWFVELDAGCLSRLDGGGKIARFGTGGIPNGLAAGPDGGIFVVDKRRKLLRFDPKAETFETLATTADGAELAEPNDIAIDPAGNVVFTCPGGSWDKPTGYVCRRRPDGSLTKIADGLSYPNGLAFDAGGKRLFLAETRRGIIHVSDYDPAGPLRLAAFAEVGGSVGPDGMALDARGQVYAAIFGWAQVAIVDGQGQVVERIGLPGGKPTNCAFDPAGKLGLVVTEAELGRLLSVSPVPPGLPLLAKPPA